MFTVAAVAEVEPSLSAMVFPCLLERQAVLNSMLVGFKQREVGVFVSSQSPKVETTIYMLQGG